MNTLEVQMIVPVRAKSGVPPPKEPEPPAPKPGLSLWPVALLGLLALISVDARKRRK